MTLRGTLEPRLSPQSHVYILPRPSLPLLSSQSYSQTSSKLYPPSSHQPNLSQPNTSKKCQPTTDTATAARLSGKSSSPTPTPSSGIFLHPLPLFEPLADFAISHCDTCKYLSGGAYTLNAIVPKKNFKLTKVCQPLRTQDICRTKYSVGFVVRGLIQHPG